MVNVSKIQAKLNGLVGFRQPFDPAYDILDAANITSRSGLRVNDNEFVKVEFLKDASDYASISDANFNTWLANKQNDSIANVVSSVFNKPDFIDRGLMYKYALNKVNTVTLPVGFFGYKIRFDCENNISLQIKRVLCDFSGTGTVKILLFNTSKLTPVQTKTVTITTDHQEVVLDWVIDNTDGIYGGEWYLGYNTTGLTVTPYARDYENSIVMRSFTNLDVYPILIPNHNTETLFDLKNFEGHALATGLNFDFTVCDDYTDLVINNEFLFSRAVLYSFQIACLQTLIASIRSNRNERMGESMVTKMLVEIEGANDGTVKKIGLRSSLYGSLNKIREEVEKLQNGYFGDGIMIETMC
jgi:hypothetical protein